MHAYLTDQELNVLQRVIADPTALQALRKVILSPLYTQGVLEPGKPANEENAIYGLASHHLMNGLSNEIIGQDVRAVIEAIRMLKKGFDELDKLKPIESPESPIKNPAR
jgi:hypothetical protein